MEIGPIFRAMTRNKLGVFLIALQIAFTMTVMINAIFIINDRNQLMAKPSGMDDANLFHISSIGFGDDFNEELVSRDDLNMIRQLPGVVNASEISAIPVSGSGSSTGVRLTEDETQAAVGTAVYRSDEQILDTMKLELIAGQNFTATDVLYRLPGDDRRSEKTIVSRALAEEVFPDLAINDVVGESFFMPGAQSLQIIGIVDRLQASWPASSLVERSLILPEQSINNDSLYLVRTEPGERDRVMAEIEELLIAQNDNRVLRRLESIEETRTEVYRLDSAMSTVLTTQC